MSLTTILIAIIGLIVLIVVHEMGHMLTAKAFGVRVPEFGVGFGPAIFKKQFGKTTYSLRIILLGGFARIAGMAGDEEALTRGDGKSEREAGDTGDGSVPPDTYYAKAPWKRALIIFAGPGVNIAFAALIFAVIFMIGTAQPTLQIQETVPGTFAAEAGIEQGDRVTAFDGQEVASWQEFKRAIAGYEPGEQVSITVERGGEPVELSGALSAAEEAPEEPLVGVRPESTEVSYGPLQALWLGVERTGQTIWLQVSGIYQIVFGDLGFYENVSGPVGIVTISSTAISVGFTAGLTLLALISTVLGVMNLLPILPLDGGHLVLTAVEKLKGSPVSTETMGKYAALGFALVLTLVLFATYADISKIISGEQFIPR